MTKKLEHTEVEVSEQEDRVQILFATGQIIELPSQWAEVAAIKLNTHFARKNRDRILRDAGAESPPEGGGNPEAA